MKRLTIKMKQISTIIALCATVLFSSISSNAQNREQKFQELDSLSKESLELAKDNQERLNILEADFGKFGTLKTSGYVQFQWQMAESENATAFASGGSFPYQSNNRFMIRRGRIKFTYNIGIATVVFQPDFTEKKVGIKDVYLKLSSENKMWQGQAGLFDRPFGYEISYSSSIRESVERSRVFLSLFPNERDLGAMGIFNIGDFTLNAGMFNGTGIAEDDDSRKDFIGRVAWLKDITNKLELGASFSYYNGGVLSGASKYYTFVDQVGFQAVESDAYTSYLREYFGVGARIKTDFGIGETNLRAEYLWGRQPGTYAQNNSPSGGFYNSNPSEALYMRDFLGGYIIYAQTIGKSKHQLVFKYDYYDPNTKFSGNNQVGYLENTSEADLAYSTFGVGYNFQLNKNIKLSAYYDMVENETTDIKIDQYVDYSERIKQNVLTLRLQVKF